MQITNELDLPTAIYEAVKNDPYHPGESDLTATQLIDPPQIVYLKRQYGDQLTEDASDRLWSLMGQIAHGILERAEESDQEITVLKEKRLYAEMDGWKIGGQFDRFVLDPEGLLVDFKLSSVWEYIFGLKPERVQQLNVLAWLARKNGYTVNALEIVMIFRDWSIGKSKTEQNYPPKQVARIPVKLWDDAKVENFIHKRLLDHKEALDGNVRECTDDERWAKSDKWAVMKQGRQSAVRVYKTEQEAKAFMNRHQDAKKMYIEHRPGENIRCANYCPVAPICQQWKRLKGEA